MAGNYTNLKDLINNPTQYGLPAWDNDAKEIEGLTIKQYLLSIINSLTVGYQFMGVASTDTSGGTPDQNVFYLAGAGTYNGFGSNPITIDAGYIGIIRWNGAWSSDAVKIADVVSVTQNTLSIGGNYAGEVSTTYDVTLHNNGTTFDSLEALLSDANLNTLIPLAVRKGGMSIKFVQSSDNNYVQYIYVGTSTAVADFTNTNNWQKMNLEEEVSQLGQEISNINEFINSNNYVYVNRPNNIGLIRDYIYNTSYIGYNKPFEKDSLLKSIHISLFGVTESTILQPCEMAIGRLDEILLPRVIKTITPEFEANDKILFDFEDDNVIIKAGEVLFIKFIPYASGALCPLTDIIEPDEYAICKMKNLAATPVSTETTYQVRGFKIEAIDYKTRFQLSDSEKIDYTFLDVSPNGGGDYTKLSDAFDAIQDSSFYHRYIVRFHGDGNEYNLLNDFPYESGSIGLKIPKFTKLLGVGGKDKNILTCRLPLDNPDIDFSALNLSETSEMEGITIIADKTRYVIHDDYSSPEENNLQDYVRKVIDCKFIAGQTKYFFVYGSGIHSGANREFINCIFNSSVAGANNSYLCHNNVNFALPTYQKFINCRFNAESVLFRTMSNNANGILNYVYFVGCRFANKLKLAEENPSLYGAGCLFEVTGYGNNLHNGDANIVIETSDHIDYSDRIDLL